MAYLHSLMPEHSQAIDHVAASHSDAQHNVFIGLTGEVKSRVFCLPDNYEVFDASLNDIKFNLQPVFSVELIAKLDEQKWEALSLEGVSFTPGCVGLNNLKLTDYANCVVQMLCRV